MFLGFFDLESDLLGLWQALNNSNVPTAATGTPTYRIYGPEGLMNNGTGNCSAFDSGNVTGVYQFTTTLAEADGYARGVTYTVRTQGTVSGSAKAGMFTFTVV
jgi:hypothetical protein